MHGLAFAPRAAALRYGALLAALLGCSAPDRSPSAGGGTGSDAAGAGELSGGAGGFGAPNGALIPARIRRLSNAEYDASVQALLDTVESPASAADFPPDLRQDGFTVNDGQRVDDVIVERLASAANALAAEARARGTLARLAPCAEEADGAELAGCAERFITSFGAKVYRRPLVDEEVSSLLDLYGVGSEEATYADGIEHVTRGLLQSAGFLYLTELGDGQLAANGSVMLTGYELAASLSYLLTSAPPDPELLEKARAGRLSEASERERQARRLLRADPRAKDSTVRLIREWLGIDGVDQIAKDSLVYPEFESLRPQIEAESKDFVRAVAFESSGTVSELFGAAWTVDSAPLGLYETAGTGPVPHSAMLNGRVGILNQAAFLSTYASAHESHPIFRGVAITRRVTCYKLDSPASFNLQVVPPEPDPTKTTRERFSVHPQDSLCQGCHQVIDPYGFAFEQFDGMGRRRETEHEKPIDSAVYVELGGELDGPYADSNELATALSRSAAVRECFARFMFRAAAATGDSAATPGEAEFIDAWRATPEAARGGIMETLIAYIERPAFALREAP